MTVRRDRSRGRLAPVAALAALLVVAAVVVFILLVPRDEPVNQATASPTLAPSPTPSLNAALLERRLTVLVIGLDSSEPRRAQGMGGNSDTMILASVNADQSEVTLISLPRDTVDIPMPDGTVWPSKVNAIYSQLGVDALVGAAEALFDVPIDGYVQADMDDLVDLVDAVGGVEVNPPESLRDPIVSLDLTAGRQTLDGPTALAYVRTRIDTDYGRAARQQEVLLELVARLVSPQTDVDISALLTGLASFDTDLPLDDLPTLFEIGRRAQAAVVMREVLRPPEFITFEGDAGDGRGYILIPDVEAIRALAARTIGQ
jgi:polyisoprenyl-teichoic acid--peptidoglycan teichoic acid transferase